MTPEHRRIAADELTARITAVEGVRGIFPHSVAAAVLLAARAGKGDAGLVLVEEKGGTTTVTARLATSRRTPSARIAQQVAREVAEVAGDDPVVLRIEFAHID